MRNGDKVTVVSNVSNHYYIIGGIYLIDSVSNNNTCVLIDNNGIRGNTIYLTDIRLINLNKENLLQDIEKIKLDLREIDEKIKFIENFNLDEFDEKLYKSYIIVNYYKSLKMSDNDIIHEISKII